MKNLNKTDKMIYSGLFLLIFIILVFSLLKVNNYLFSLISLAANIFLIIIYRLIRKILKVEFTKWEKYLMLLVITCFYVFYFISILTRKFIYYWDYSCYYNLQVSLENSFNVSLLDGIKSFIGSTWSGEYGNFISFFPEIIFSFTKKTINSYVLSCVLVYVPYIILSTSILIKKIVQVFKIKEAKKFTILALSSFVLFPILHATFIYGQPDLFGLAFIFLIIALTINYDFKKLEKDRLTILLLITLMLLISRRWYMYFILAYYLGYGLKIIISNIKNKKDLKIIIKNCMVYLSIAIMVFLVTLFPLFKNIIINNYANSYNYYLTGGFFAELINQVHHLGYIFLLIILIGMVYGLKNRNYRLNSVINIFQYFLMVFLFTRIQNMGFHHSLILLPIYLYFTYMFIMFMLEKDKHYILTFTFIIILLINFMFGLMRITNTKVFTDVKLSTPKQEDYEQIKKVANWLKNNLDENNTAYMITHNNEYNPDKLRNFYIPDTTIQKYLPYGSAILGTHMFPVELFTSKYIITTTPFVNVSIENKYNDVFNKLVKEGKFNLINNYDMKNGYSILIYERVKDVDLYEANLYIEAIKEETKAYDDIYLKVIKNFIIDNNLN